MPHELKPPVVAAPGTCPYSALPDHAFWSRSVVRVVSADVDPLVRVPFKIGRSHRIASAGSCFAQHIARRLKDADYNYLVVEPGYERLSARLMTKFNYGTFSARYGNIYTARQLLQLFQRAYGTFTPAEPFWREGLHWVDPFRPLIQPHGFESLREAELDRVQHLAAVRRLMETLDVFVFTFGLTETWVCKADGAVLPVCPGCGAGQFDPQRYEFKNFGVDDVVADFGAFARELRRVNPNAKIITTVSPVPLVATFSDQHVLAATTYSKSVLRVAAEQLATTLDNCIYFPSYEVITGAFSRGGYFATDLRSVEEEGVDHVMSIFFRRCTEDGPQAAQDRPAPSPKTATPKQRPNILDVVCEEYAALNAAAETRNGA